MLIPNTDAENDMLKILALGDVCGASGTEYLLHGRRLARFKNHVGADFIIANGENSAEGNGILPTSADALFEAGVDIITGGNHTWQRREIYPYFDDHRYIIRPANYPDVCPGEGYVIADIKGYRLLCVNLCGVTFMDPVASPFDTADRILRELEGKYDFAVFDIHAEATSEKQALGWYLCDRAAAIWGTHTHVATADARILCGACGYITDLGMCGSRDGVLGVDRDVVINRFRTRLPSRNITARGNEAASGALFSIDTRSFKCVSCEGVEF